MKILMVLTSHNQLGNTGRKTGFWLEEFAAPYFVFRDAGVQLTLASPKGGQPPLDPKSDLPENQTAAMTRFKQDAAAQTGGVIQGFHVRGDPGHSDIVGLGEIADPFESSERGLQARTAGSLDNRNALTNDGEERTVLRC